MFVLVNSISIVFIYLHAVLAKRERRTRGMATLTVCIVIAMYVVNSSVWLIDLFW